MRRKLALKVRGSSSGYCRREGCFRNQNSRGRPAMCRKREPVNLRKSSYLGWPGISKDMVLATRQILSGEAVLDNDIVRHPVDCVRGINVQVMPSRRIAPWKDNRLPPDSDSSTNKRDYR